MRSGEIHPRELWQAHQERIAALDPKLRAFVRVFDAYTEPVPGPLYGVPVTVKDSLDVAGYPTLTGSLYRMGHRAAADSACAARLRAAGAVLLGKTNCPEFLANYETDNHITGWTANPWNLERSAGGSSGGEAAAIAACCSAGGVGSDGGGSIRIPAHFCGIAGLKPTPGRVSGAGHSPEIAHPGGLLGVVGPMARTVEDVRLLYEALAGYDTQDPFSAPVTGLAREVAGLRVGVMETWQGVAAAPAIAGAVRRAAGMLADVGCVVDGFAPRGMERAVGVWDFFFNELSDPFKRQVIDSDPSKVHWTGLELLRAEPAAPTGVEVVTQLAIRDKMRAAVLRQMEEVPVLLTPPCAIAAWRFRERPVPILDAMSFATPWNLLGFPALVVPFGFTDDGLPVGIQLVGRPWEEETLLAVGEALEAARGVFPLAALDIAADSKDNQQIIS